MFCSKCGKELNAGENFCSNCGNPVELLTDYDNEKEKVIKKGLCNRVKGKLFVENGHGILTNKRFIYSKHSLEKIAAMGVLVNLTEGTYDFEIPIAQISEIKDGRHGLGKTIIIRTNSGEEYNFCFANHQTWKIEFNNLMR